MVEMAKGQRKGDQFFIGDRPVVICCMKGSGQKGLLESMEKFALESFGSESVSLLDCSRLENLPIARTAFDVKNNILFKNIQAAIFYNINEMEENEILKFSKEINTLVDLKIKVIISISPSASELLNYIHGPIELNWDHLKLTKEQINEIYGVSYNEIKLDEFIGITRGFQCYSDQLIRTKGVNSKFDVLQEAISIDLLHNVFNMKLPLSIKKKMCMLYLARSGNFSDFRDSNNLAFESDMSFIEKYLPVFGVDCSRKTFNCVYMRNLVVLRNIPKFGLSLNTEEVQNVIEMVFETSEFGYGLRIMDLFLDKAEKIQFVLTHAFELINNGQEKRVQECLEKSQYEFSALHDAYNAICVLIFIAYLKGDIFTYKKLSEELKNSKFNSQKPPLYLKMIEIVETVVSCSVKDSKFLESKVLERFTTMITSSATNNQLSCSQVEKFMLEDYSFLEVPEKLIALETIANIGIAKNLESSFASCLRTLVRFDKEEMTLIDSTEILILVSFTEQAQYAGDVFEYQSDIKNKCEKVIEQTEFKDFKYEMECISKLPRLMEGRIDNVTMRGMRAVRVAERNRDKYLEANGYLVASIESLVAEKSPTGILDSKRAAIIYKNLACEKMASFAAMVSEIGRAIYLSRRSDFSRNIDLQKLIVITEHKHMMKMVEISLTNQDEKLAEWFCLNDRFISSSSGRKIISFVLQMMGTFAEGLIRYLPSEVSEEYYRNFTKCASQHQSMELAKEVEKELSINLFDGLNMKLNGEIVEPVGWKRRKALYLVLLLAVSNGPISRDRLLEQLWPSAPADSSLGNLYVTMSAARKRLGTAANGESFIQTNQIQFQLNDSCVETDIGKFRKLARCVLINPHKKTDEQLVEICVEISEKYSGSLMVPDSSLFEAFNYTRHELDSMFVDCMSKGANLALEIGRPIIALWLVREGRRKDRFRDSLIKLALEACGRDGQREEGIKIYHEYKKYLAEEIAITPKEDIQDAYELLIMDNDDRKRYGNKSKIEQK